MKKIAFETKANIYFVITDEEISEKFLGASMQKKIALWHSERQSAWKMARNALLFLTQKIDNINIDPICLNFPHPHFSISHHKKLAIAVYRECANGVGVDLEPVGRKIRPSLERYLQTEAEKKFFDEKKTIALWCLREAMFKADLANSSQSLQSYQVDNFDNEEGSGSGNEKKFSLYLKTIDVNRKSFYCAFAKANEQHRCDQKLFLA